jgi:preprotein translocase subunit SecG
MNPESKLSNSKLTRLSGCLLMFMPIMAILMIYQHDHGCSFDGLLMQICTGSAISFTLGGFALIKYKGTKNFLPRDLMLFVGIFLLLSVSMSIIWALWIVTVLISHNSTNIHTLFFWGLAPMLVSGLLLGRWFWRLRRDNHIAKLTPSIEP